MLYKPTAPILSSYIISHAKISHIRGISDHRLSLVQPVNFATSLIVQKHGGASSVLRRRGGGGFRRRVGAGAHGGLLRRGVPAGAVGHQARRRRGHRQGAPDGRLAGPAALPRLLRQRLRRLHSAGRHRGHGRGEDVQGQQHVGARVRRGRRHQDRREHGVPGERRLLRRHPRRCRSRLHCCAGRELVRRAPRPAGRDDGEPGRRGRQHPEPVHGPAGAAGQLPGPGPVAAGPGGALRRPHARLLPLRLLPRPPLQRDGHPGPDLRGGAGRAVPARRRRRGACVAGRHADDRGHGLLPGDHAGARAAAHGPAAVPGRRGRQRRAGAVLRREPGQVLGGLRRGDAQAGRPEPAHRRGGRGQGGLPGREPGVIH